MQSVCVCGREVPGSIPISVGVFLCGVCIFSLCLCVRVGFLTPASSHSADTCRLIGESKLTARPRQMSAAIGSSSPRL